jgi:putative copper export protein
MTEVSVDVVLGILRLGGYVGYVLVAGTVAFSALIWPVGFRDRTLLMLSRWGAVIALLTTIADPIVRASAYGNVFAETGGRTWAVAGVLRIAVLVLVLTLSPDLAGPAEIGPGRRIAAGAATTVIAVTYALQSAAIASRLPALALLATTLHVLATAAWLGGLVALATAVIPRSHHDALHAILPRFSYLAVTCVVGLTVTGGLHAVLAADGVRPLLSSTYGLVLLVKVGLFALMLLLGNQGRAYATRVARRELEDFDAATTPVGLRVLAVSIGAELSLALSVLAVTSLLVVVAPAAP